MWARNDRFKTESAHGGLALLRFDKQTDRKRAAGLAAQTSLTFCDVGRDDSAGTSQRERDDHTPIRDSANGSSLSVILHSRARSPPE